MFNKKNKKTEEENIKEERDKFRNRKETKVENKKYENKTIIENKTPVSVETIYEKTKEQVKTGNYKIENLKCLNCDRLMKEYDGRNGKFIGCPNWQQDVRCKKTYTIYK